MSLKDYQVESTSTAVWRNISVLKIQMFSLYHQIYEGLLKPLCAVFSEVCHEFLHLIAAH